VKNKQKYSLKTIIVLLVAVMLFTITIASVISGWQYLLENIFGFNEETIYIVHIGIFIIVIFEWFYNRKEKSKITYLNAFPYMSLIIMFIGLLINVCESLINIIYVFALMYLLFLILKMQFIELKKIK
jgi:hypothetical protein